MEPKFNRICNELAHSLAAYERACHSTDSANQRRYWRGKCERLREELSKYCESKGIAVFFAVQLPLWDDLPTDYDDPS